MTATATKNGTAPVVPDVVFPVDSFREAAPHLRRPFTTAAVKFKVQSTWPKDNPTGGLVVAYIDARLVVERLNLVCPHLWVDAYAPGHGGLQCSLTIDGITRHDIGEGNGKALYSDALKRAAVKFGVGVSLYAIPQSFIGTQDGSAKAKRSNKGPTLVLTDSGEAGVRRRYAQWLEATGIEAFGQPLNHGDVEGSQGDAEASDADHPAAAVEAAPDDPSDKPLTNAARAKIARAIGEAGVEPAMLLAAAGFDSIDAVTTVGAAMRVRAELDKAVAS